MTVQDVSNTIDYIGDDIAISFVFIFRVDDVSWVDLNFTTDFDDIILNADQDTSPGGTVNYTVAPSTGQLIRITRITPQDQDTDYTRFDAFDSESHEDALDQLTMEIQDLHEIIGGFTNTPLLPIGTIDQSILRWNLANQLWEEFITYIFPLVDGAAGQAMTTDGAGNLSFSSVVGAIDDGTVDGQVAIWDVGNDQWEPVADTVLRVNPQVPPTAPLGRFIAGGFSTTDVRKSFLHQNIGSSVGTVWSTDRNGGTPSGFFSRSAFNGAIDIHDWGYWNPGNLTGISNFRITEDNEFILDFTLGITERAAALANVAGRGQYWVRDDQTPMFTTDLGVEFELNAGAAFRGALVQRSTDLLLGVAVETVVSFDVEAYDTDAIHDTGGAPTRLTVPTGVTRVKLFGSGAWKSSNAGFRTIRFRKNGGTGTIDPGLTGWRPEEMNASSFGGLHHLQLSSPVITVVATDFFEMTMESDNGIDGEADQMVFGMELIE